MLKKLKKRDISTPYLVKIWDWPKIYETKSLFTILILKLTYLIKKNLIKITLAMANGLEPPARMIIVSANEADKALSGALLTCEWSQFSAFPLTPDPTQPTGQQLNLLFKSRLFPIN